MRLCLWCVWTCWILTLHSAAQHPPDRVEGGVQPRWRRQNTGTPVRRAGEEVSGRRTALRGPRVCGGRCCVGWTLSPKTKRCTKPRCLPRCHNGGLCRQSNRCVCRRGFHGYRCEVATVPFPLAGRPLTSVRPSSVPHLDPRPPSSPPGPEPPTKPALLSTPPASSTTITAATPTETSSSPETGAPVLSPPPTRAETPNKEEDAKTPDSGPVKFGDDGVKTEGKGGVSKVFLMQEENQASPKSPQVGRRAERTPEVKVLHPQTGDTEEVTDIRADLKTEEGPNLKEASGSQTQKRLMKSPNLESLSWSETEEKDSLDVRESSETEDKSLIRQSEMLERSTASEIQSPESNSSSKDDNRLNLEFSAGPSKDLRTDLESDLKSEGEETVEAAGEKKKNKKEEEEEVKSRGAKKQLLSLREAQAMLLRKTLSRGGRGDKMAALLMKHIEKERKKLTVTSSLSSSNASSSSTSSSASSVKTSVRTFHTQKGQYTVHFAGPSVLCPLLCKNGGVCLQKDRCVCPPNFTGKFCQIPVVAAAASTGGAAAPPSSTNEIVKPALLSAMASNQELTQSEFILPLGHNQETARSGAPAPPLVKVRVQHPPEASVKIHQVLKVSGYSPSLRTLSSSSSSSGSAGAPAPAGGGVQAQTIRGDGTYNRQSEFKYCFREVKDGQCSSPLPGLRTKEMCCRGVGKAWGITDCVLCPDNKGQGNSSCPAGFERGNGTKCVDVNECLEPGLCENGLCVNTRGSYSCVCRVGFILDASHGICISQSVISEEKGQCYRVLGAGQGPSSCSLPILRNITKQICCCSRVGKAWGHNCQRCPYFGSVAFKEICPAGPGYHYSATALQFTQRVAEQLGSRGAPLVTSGSQGSGSSSSGATRSEQRPPTSGATAGGASTSFSAAGGASTSFSAAGGASTSFSAAGGASTSFSAAGAGSSAGSAGTRSTYTRPSSPQLQPQPQPPPRPQPQPQPPPRPQPQPQPPPRPQPQPQPPPRPQPQPQPPPRVQPQPQSPTRSQPQPQPQPPPRSQPLPQPPPRVQPQPQPPPRVQPQPPPPSRPVDSPSSRPDQPGSTGVTSTQDKPQTPGRPGTLQIQSEPAPSQPRPQPPSTGSQAGGRTPSESRPQQPTGRGDSLLPSRVQPESPESESRPGGGLRPAVSPTTRVQAAVRGVCESRPGVCGRGRCVDQPGGRYTCVCDQGYQANSQRTFCQDVNECVQSPGVCSAGECVNSMGSYRCVCPSGYRSSSQQTSCQDIDECQQNPCSNGRCDNTPGSYRCVCRLGYRLSGNACTDVDECEDPLQCPGQECINSQGSYRCVSCQPGYRLFNRICTDVDECRQAPCANGRCENTPGSYRCVCRHGYKLQNNTCTDIDECSEPSQCPGQMCVNTVGSYRCVSCRPGYTLINRQCADVNECEDRESCPGQQCVNTEGSYSCVDCQQGYHSVNGLCADVDECEQASQCPGQQCVNTVGSYRCVSCQPGYSGQDGSCQDVDECASAGACEAERVCVNTVGSFRCDCRPGYRSSGVGRQCRDINECLEGDFCFSRGECVNTAGSYMCVCSQGFTLSDNKTACLDVDECAKPGVCSDGRCLNTEGSFQCQCQSGFTTNPEKTTCLDVDECVSSGGSVCGSLQRCENTIGSYRCFTSCEPGYQVTPTGSCVDVNECANQTVCGEHASCQNLVGTYVCVCHQGFTSTVDGKACVDEDECVSMPGVCGSARCENVEGSFMCECDRRGYEFDTASKQCVNTAAHAEVLPPLPAARPGELRECYYNLAERGTCSLLATNTTQQECCCTVGEGWGLGCQYHTCPRTGTAQFLALCPSGKGYVTTGPGAFSYRDVDECKRFHPEVCKSGVCVNNIPGYNCYCASGYVYNSTLLECVDHDECEEESCVGGICVNTVGSYYCSCQHPLVLDDTQRNCVNSSHLTVDENLSVCWQHVTADLVCQSPLLGAQVTFTDCCCLYGEGWGMECALCPPTDSEDYANLCSSYLSPPFPESFPESFPPAVVPRRDFSSPDYDDYSPGGGGPPFRGRTPDRYSPPDGYGRSDYSTGYYPEGDFGPLDSSPPRRPFRIPPDPRAEMAFGARPPPPSSRSQGSPLNLAPLPGAPYHEQGEDDEGDVSWRPDPPFPPFPPFAEGRRGGGEAAPRRVYERRHESYAGLSTAEDCAILHGCENGRCIRVAEGYTCDCYQGYELDMTSMTCRDINECAAGVDVEFPCVNARCVNTDGSFSCVCGRGYVMSRRQNHCVAA